MTTIAIDRQTIAADGLATRSGEIVGRRMKKLHAFDGVVYALSGCAAMTDVVIDWHRKGADPALLPRNFGDKDGPRWTLIVVNSRGVFRFTHDCPYPESQNLPIAFGSGADYATGAMLAGADARRAVEIACDREVHSGGEIMAIDISGFMGSDD